MMNLLGCSKENFYTLMGLMNYKKDKVKDTYIFLGENKKIKKIFKNRKITSPFDKLLSLKFLPYQDHPLFSPDVPLKPQLFGA